jgi:hypothetical protein
MPVEDYHSMKHTSNSVPEPDPVNHHKYSLPIIKIHELTKCYKEGEIKKTLFSNLELNVRH